MTTTVTMLRVYLGVPFYRLPRSSLFRTAAAGVSEWWMFFTTLRWVLIFWLCNFLEGDQTTARTTTARCADKDFFKQQITVRCCNMIKMLRVKNTVNGAKKTDTCCKQMRVPAVGGWYGIKSRPSRGSSNGGPVSWNQHFEKPNSQFFIYFFLNGLLKWNLS